MTKDRATRELIISHGHVYLATTEYGDLDFPHRMPSFVAIARGSTGFHEGYTVSVEVRDTSTHARTLDFGKISVPPRFSCYAGHFGIDRLVGELRIAFLRASTNRPDDAIEVHVGTPFFGESIHIFKPSEVRWIVKRTRE